MDFCVLNLRNLIYVTVKTFLNVVIERIKTWHLSTKNTNKNATEHKAKHPSEHNTMQRNSYTDTTDSKREI